MPKDLISVDHTSGLECSGIPKFMSTKPSPRDVMAQAVLHGAILATLLGLSDGDSWCSKKI